MRRASPADWEAMPSASLCVASSGLTLVVDPCPGLGATNSGFESRRMMSDCFCSGDKGVDVPHIVACAGRQRACGVDIALPNPCGARAR